MAEDPENEEPVSPVGRMLIQPRLHCTILCIIGFQDTVSVPGIKSKLLQTFAKHKRFSSIMQLDGSGREKWVKTRVNIEEHVIVANILPEAQKSASPVEDYAAALAVAPPLDPRKPLWEVHILNVPSSDSAASCILRVHHSLGDGISLVSLLVATLRSVSDPENLPSMPLPPRKQHPKGFFAGLWFVLWTVLATLWYTVTEVGRFAAVTLFSKDSSTPIKGSPGVERMPKRIASTEISLEDMKTVKKAVNGTINDVMLGFVSAGIASYLREKSPKQNFESHRMHATALVNIRKSPGLQASEIADMMEGSSKARWGNQIGYLVIPIPLKEHTDPLEHVRSAKKISTRKKLSLEAPFTYAAGSLTMKLCGPKITADVTYKTLANTTFSISNVMGPLEPMMLDGNPITSIVPTVVGQPQSLFIHLQSYAGKAKLVATAAKDIIPDPQNLLQHCKDALERMKQAAITAKEWTS
ncbi:hypothetical protein SELMODRAFT_269987 [Selaginella moellendorffii]|uniref:Uncharacterized protein n=1 Tax=Selaginella moellendorffii TaxID=88036 RepID=D8TB38_SELML|nr:hypothetical protein SELMODRAFT_269987 [Selaginella moellendorffii]